MNTLRKVFRFFVRPDLSQQAFEAYYFRLPESIDVSWQRDGNYIVGKIKAGNKEFFTQGENPENFVDMVNDSIYTAFEIPFDYIEAVGKAKAFSPDRSELEKLYNGNIPSSNLSIMRGKEMQVA